MTTYRFATIADIPRLASYAIEGLRPERQQMVLSRPKVEATISHFVHSRSDFSLMAEADGQIVGAIAVLVADMLWFERCEAHVVMCRATKPGVGRELIHRAMQWAWADMRIQRVLWSLEDDAPRATARLARMVGFETSQTLCVAHRRASNG